ncbi:SRPBCC domain-containing protein [Modestobacter sp. VKM Ac-2986]|uniref:SRPBCC domain-containing protein n=1 Tax=Modestobacter sp. VKM Ac-2986 TaxID=3004140 RepID=UPI0022AA89BB|nr:SRPBCC domain-containing protein [Modestobacter sp. VKM Ac-2986]MCZ2827668.1 SRPBCC domain-containing protein [Modestobacter sp. VKM Ac-2986]
MTGDERTGEVDELAEGVRLRFRRRWPLPVADVWAALTGPDRLPRWIGTYDGVREPGGAGTFTMTHEEQVVGEPLRVVACAAPVRLVVEWDTEGGWRVDLDLDQEGDEAVLTFTQLFPPGTDVVDYALGWHWYLDKLDAEVAGGPVPPAWEDFLAEVGPAYGRG